MIKLKPNEDASTGVSKKELNTKNIALTFNTETRARILRKALMDGSDCEKDTADIIAKGQPQEIQTEAHWCEGRQARGV